MSFDLCYTLDMDKSHIKKSILLILAIVALNVGLAIAKLHVGLSTNSLCIMLDSINSFLDVITCIVSVVALAVVLRSREETLYGRAEYLAGFVVSAVAVVLGGVFLLRSIDRLAMPEPVWFGVQSTVIISVAILVKVGIAVACHFLSKRFNSVILRAIMLDSILDAVVTATSLISFVVSGRVNYAVDAILGIVLSVLILIFAVRMVVSNVKTIVVGQPTEAISQRIHTVLSEQPCVASVGRIQLHDYGTHQQVGTVEVSLHTQSLDEVLEQCASLEAVIHEKTGVRVQLVPRPTKE